MPHLLKSFVSASAPDQGRRDIQGQGIHGGEGGERERKEGSGFGSAKEGATCPTNAPAILWNILCYDCPFSELCSVHLRQRCLAPYSIAINADHQGIGSTECSSNCMDICAVHLHSVEAGDNVEVHCSMVTALAGRAQWAGEGGGGLGRMSIPHPCDDFLTCKNNEDGDNQLGVRGLGAQQDPQRCKTTLYKPFSHIALTATAHNLVSNFTSRGESSRTHQAIESSNTAGFPVK